MKQKLILYTGIGITILIIGVVIGYIFGTSSQKNSQGISSYDQCVKAGYPVQKSLPPRCSIPRGKSFTQDKTITLQGKVVCLPHKNPNGPQTLECAAGLLTIDGKYYSLHSNSTHNSLADSAGSDKQVRITGNLEQETDDKYQSEGTLQIKSYEYL